MHTSIVSCWQIILPPHHFAVFNVSIVTRDYESSLSSSCTFNTQFEVTLIFAFVHHFWSIFVFCQCLVCASYNRFLACFDFQKVHLPVTLHTVEGGLVIHPHIVKLNDCFPVFTCFYALYLLRNARNNNCGILNVTVLRAHLFFHPLVLNVIQGKTCRRTFYANSSFARYMKVNEISLRPDDSRFYYSPSTPKDVVIEPISQNEVRSSRLQKRSCYAIET